MEHRIDGRRAWAYTGGRAFDPALPTVVFIHGAQNDHSVWALQSRWFAHHGWSVLAVDLPGHGNSDGPALASVAAMGEWVSELLRQAGVERAALVGHSMGSLIALDIASRAPDTVSALALVGTALPMQVSEALLTMTRDAPAQAIDLITSWSYHGWAQKPQSPGPGSFVAWGGRRLMQRVAARHGDAVLATDFAAVDGYKDAAAAAARVSCPVLVLSGDRDMMTPPRAARAMAKALSDSRTVLIPGAGHAVMNEAPDATLEALAAFLRATVPVTQGA